MTAATSAEVLVTLRGIIPTLVPSLQRVAERILDDPSRAAAETISELARGAATSEATVLRLCRQLGIRGYRELRVALAAESGREQALSDTREIGGDIGRTDDLDSVIDSVTYADQQAIADTARTIDRAALATAVDLVAGARRVDLVGVGASAVVALDLQQKLHRIGLIAFAWSDTHAALTAAALLGPADVMIGISHTGATRDTAEAIREASIHGASTIGLTSAPRSPLALQVDVLLVTAARETTFRSGATSSRIAALSVVDVLFVAVAQRRYDATVRALESTRNAVLPRRFDSNGGTVSTGNAGSNRNTASNGSTGRVIVTSPTEDINPATELIDQVDSLAVLRMINTEDALVPAAVAALLPTLARLVDEAIERVRAGGRVHYFGAGTSGRLGVLDAAELLPTFGIDDGVVVAHQAGGPRAFVSAVENAEDDEDSARTDAADIAGGDVVLGLAASGRTPYVGAALTAARAVGARTALVTSNPRAPLLYLADHPLVADTGPEAIAGSTRLKAGSALKLVLNSFSTALMVGLGHTYRNLMVDMHPTNAKLRGRSIALVQDATGVTAAQAGRALDVCGDIKTSVVYLLAARSGSDGVDEVRNALSAAGGRVRLALGLLPVR